MVHAHGGDDPAPPATAPPPAGPAGDFTITLKGWRSQLRWAMTQREEDPARVWLEVISIDERSKRALAFANEPEHMAKLQEFRAKLESSIASLTEDLGDENVAPLYSWLDLVRQRRRLAGKIDEARAAVAQARAARASESASIAPNTEDEATEQLGRAQIDLDQWRGATPPEPPPEVRAAWDEAGGDALAPTMPRDPMAVGKRGGEARAIAQRALDAGRVPGKHPWVKSRSELIALPVAGALTLLPALFALAWSGSAAGTVMTGVALASLLTTATLVAFGAWARALEKKEKRAAIDWVWHHAVYAERARLAELEAGWLRALEGAHKALRSFDAKAGTGGQLRDFEQWRPDLADMVHEVARDTEAPA